MNKLLKLRIHSKNMIKLALKLTYDNFYLIPFAQARYNSMKFAKNKNKSTLF